MTNKEWLEHLPNEVMKGARNNNLCSYVIALEGWRRGLTLRYYSKAVKQESLHAPGLLFSLSDGSNTHMFYKSRGSRVKGEAFTIGDNKFKAKKVLEDANVPVPKGELFGAEIDDHEIIKYANEIGYPVVLKPSNAAQGKGVIANINNEDYLIRSLKYVREELGYKTVILEEHVYGNEYRVYVMKDEVVAVLNRDPANVIGDGKSTIGQLIEGKNQERKKNPRLYSCLIKVDYEIENNLKSMNRSLETVPKLKEKVYLRSKSNITSGGDSIDVTDEFPVEIKQIAINALKAIPNFPNGGVDIMVNFNKPLNESAKVIELTPVPQIGSLVFPMKGKARDVPSAIIDEYFPNTKSMRNNNPNVYFYLPEIIRPLMSKAASEITVVPCPTNIENQKKLILKGDLRNAVILRRIRKLALESGLHGYCKNIDQNSIEIGVAGVQKNIDTFISLCKSGSLRIDIESITESEWGGPIRVGFEIKLSKKKKKAAVKTNIPAKRDRIIKRIMKKLIKK